MRILFIIPLLLFTNMAMAQAPLTYSQVIEVDSTSKEQLYERALKWITTAAGASKGEVITRDKENGEISAKLSMPFKSQYNYNEKETRGFVWYTLTIYVKDNKYKYEFTNFIHEGSTGESAYGWGWVHVNSHWDAVNFGLVTKEQSCPLEISKVDGDKYCAKLWAELKTHCKMNAADILNRLHSAMQTPVATKKDDW